MDWVERLIIVIISVTVTLNIVIGRWPSENEFNNGVNCGSLAAQNLARKMPINMIKMEDIYREAHAVKMQKINRWLK